MTIWLMTYIVALVWTYCMGWNGVSCVLKVSVWWQVMRTTLLPQATDTLQQTEDDRHRWQGTINRRQWETVGPGEMKESRQREAGEGMIERWNRVRGGRVDWSKQSGISRWKWVASREENGLSFGKTAFICVSVCLCAHRMCIAHMDES